MKRATLVFCGVAAFASCCFGTSVLDCDTNAQILGIGTNARIPTGSKTYTIELWMKPTVLETGERRCLGQFSGSKGRMLVAYTGGTAGIFNGSGNGWTTGTTKFALNTWYHVACVFDDSSEIKTAVYVNGVLEGSTTTAAVGIDERYITLGGATSSRLTSDTTKEYEAFKGRIADVRVWSVARSQAEIVANYQKRLAGDETGLIAYWPLDASYDNGQTVEEAKTGDRNVVVPHYSIVEDSGLTLAPADHRAGGYQRRCASWGSSARGLETDIRTSLGSSFTLETWVYPSSSNNGEHWILDQFYGTEGRFLFSFIDNQPGFFVGGSMPSGHVRVPRALEVGAWTHLALTREGYDFTIYTNGIAAVTTNVPNAYVTKDGYPFCICSSATPGGNNNRGVPFTGSQREVRVWNVCRTGEQIRETMGKTLFGNESGLRGYWPLDEGNGSNISNRGTGGSCKNVIAEPVWNRRGFVSAVRNRLGTTHPSPRSSILTERAQTCSLAYTTTIGSRIFRTDTSRTGRTTTGSTASLACRSTAGSMSPTFRTDRFAACTWTVCWTARRTTGSSCSLFSPSRCGSATSRT